MEVAYNSRYEFEAKESVTRRRHGLNGRAARAEGQRSFESRRLAALNKELYSHIYSCRKTLRRLLTFVQRTVCALSLSSFSRSAPRSQSSFLYSFLVTPRLPFPPRSPRPDDVSSPLPFPSFLPFSFLFHAKLFSLSLTLFCFRPPFYSISLLPTPVRHFGTNLLLPSLEDCFSIFSIEFQAAVWNYITLDVIKKISSVSRQRLPPSLSLCVRQCRDKRSGRRSSGVN